MPGPVYRNIFLSDTSKAESFTKKAQVRISFPDRDRFEHGQSLKRQLEAAWQAAANQVKAVGYSDRHGLYIEIRSKAGYPLLSKSLENMRSRIRLVNIQLEQAPDGFITRATIFIPEDKKHLFMKKIDEYLTSEGRGNKPKNNDLIRSVEDIRAAVVESFWTSTGYPIPDVDAQWCEIWLNTDIRENVEQFKSEAIQLEIEIGTDCLYFPERTVTLGLVNRQQMDQLIAASPFIAEFRKLSVTAGFFVELEPEEQVEFAEDLIVRTALNNDPSVSICILDGGVNNGHILINPLLSDQNRYTAEKQWGLSDSHIQGHGTKMAGIAAYGDLQRALESSEAVTIDHVLESGKILPPHGSNPYRLYGHIMNRVVGDAIIQNPDYKRIICMAVTDDDEKHSGKPSSWSASIDALLSSPLGSEMLAVISAGNVVDRDDYLVYPDSNLIRQIQDPGQSWNAVTVGAYTEKVALDSYQGQGRPLAPCGGLSPFSTTSMTWDKKWPIKPEIVLEGGNIVSESTGCFTCEDLSELTTSHETTRRQFDIFEGTSCATAKAGWMAAILQNMYLEAWPETIRALMVHSAEWTPTMLNQFLNGKNPERCNKYEIGSLLKICGYGVPDIDRAIQCAANSVNLIIQGQLQPYKESDGEPKLNEMHFHTIPWPKDLLLEMGEVEAKLKVTLSYYIEPGPGEIGWKDRYRYPSSLLRFDVRSALETEHQFKSRINTAIQNEETDSDDNGSPIQWVIGQNNRNRGSVHSDYWVGNAADLAGSNIIGVFPASGWWKTRKHLKKANDILRYSLVVSLSTPSEEIDLYTPIVTSIRVPIEIPVR